MNNKKGLIFLLIKQQQKAQTVSGWSNFVGKQTLFEQLNRLKKNMYGNNGTKQDQSNRSTNDMNNNFTDIEDKEIEAIAISPSGGSISSNGKQYQNMGPWDNSANSQYNSLQRPGNHLICSFCKIE